MAAAAQQLCVNKLTPMTCRSRERALESNTPALLMKRKNKATRTVPVCMQLSHVYMAHKRAPAIFSGATELP